LRGSRRWLTGGTLEDRRFDELAVLLFGSPETADQEPGPSNPPSDAPTAAEVWAAVVDRLLAIPSANPDQVRQDVADDPVRAYLIRLPGPDGVRRLPWFQFDANGMPLPSVLTVNEILAADTDPWGAADWWAGTNAWLEAAPIDALGRISDGELVAAALALIPED